MKDPTHNIEIFDQNHVPFLFQGVLLSVSRGVRGGVLCDDLELQAFVQSCSWQCFCASKNNDKVETTSNCLKSLHFKLPTI
jgi:hypothetical protein